MTTVYDVPAEELVKAVAEKLKKMRAISMPKWCIHVKTGCHKELPPAQPDWWYIRCASILRQIYIHGPLGVSRLRTRYGGRDRRGVKREHFRKASGKIIRAALSQLEHAELVVKTKEGRKISPKGQSLLDNTAHEIFMKIKERYTPVWIRKPIAAAEGEEEESQT
ncbi:MAG: 30S ribosomal protein S19e [Canidatus Methanoxibalbensis ujae]|nr:30S ribosomal protein S19e [Candidatus Methanoxibalbensis ujae]MCW7078632.1 30S ribosomal protein S19e [Candidatus Methanoxibalbensis ujae]